MTLQCSTLGLYNVTLQYSTVGLHNITLQYTTVDLYNITLQLQRSYFVPLITYQFPPIQCTPLPDYLPPRLRLLR